MNDLSRIFTFNGNNVTFKNQDGSVMVNATEMAKSFNKLPGDWIRQKSTEEFLETLSSDKGIPISALIQVVKGGNDKSSQGTWLHEDAAIEFARWLSPMFAIWCNDRIKEIIQYGKIEQDIEPGSYREYINTKMDVVKQMSDILRLDKISRIIAINPILREVGLAEIE